MAKKKTLYAANIEDIGEPVDAAPAAPAAPAKKEKKPPTEKQLAARAKFAENRKRKLQELKDAKDKEIELAAEKEKQEQAKAQELADKKIERAKKRKAKKMEKMENDDISAVVDEAIRSLPPSSIKKKKRKIETNEPPEWFLKYLDKKEERKPVEKRKPKELYSLIFPNDK